MERQIKDQALSFEDAAKLRVRLAYPIMVRFEKWLVTEHAKVIKGSPIDNSPKRIAAEINRLKSELTATDYQLSSLTNIR